MGPLLFFLLTWTICLDDEYKAFCKSARQLSDQQALSLVQQQECCLFVFLDGSAHFFDDFLKVDFIQFYRNISS